MPPATRSCPCLPTASWPTTRAGLGLDPVIQEEVLKFLPLPNDFTIGDGLNTAGYRWNSPSEAPVDTLTARVDYNLSQRHALFARYSTAFRNDLINDIINTTPTRPGAPEIPSASTRASPSAGSTPPSAGPTPSPWCVPTAAVSTSPAPASTARTATT